LYEKKIKGWVGKRTLAARWQFAPHTWGRLKGGSKGLLVQESIVALDGSWMCGTYFMLGMSKM
jgi:hypothetical protein